MIQVTFDTAKDSVEELEASLRMLQDAVARRKGAGSSSRPPTLDMPQPPPPATPVQDDETALDTPFLKIKVKHDEPAREPAPEGDEPSLQDLLTNDSITEEQLSRVFKAQGGKIADAPAEQEVAPSYIEIIEYDEEKKD